VSRFDAEAFGCFLNRPTKLLSQFMHTPAELNGDAAERGGLTMMGRLRNAFSGGGHGRRLVLLSENDEIFNDRL